MYFFFFFNFIVFHNYKITIVTSEIIETEKEKCHLYDERKSPTGTTLSVYWWKSMCFFRLNLLSALCGVRWCEILKIS